MSPAERIERREYKYLTDEATAAALRAAIQPFCSLDAHAARQPDQRYTIDSLYFDTPNLALYRANVRELVQRFKLRIRSYPSAGQNVFFEVKARHNDVIAKTRGRVPRKRWLELLADPWSIPATFTGPGRAAVERFLALVHTHHARPVTVVRYEREPWVSQIDSYARVTFDRQIRSQTIAPSSTWQVVPGPGGWRSMDQAVPLRTATARMVVELKFTSAVPRWMVNIVQCFDLERSAFSKYGTSIEAWQLSPTSRPLDRAPNRRTGGLT